LIPVKPGSAIKTDRRDARKLAELLRAGMLTEVLPPTEDEEAVRDLTRSRDDAQRDLTRARNRLSKFLLRRGCVYAIDRKPTWSQKYRSWLRALSFEHGADQVIFEDYLLAVEQVEGRLEALTDRIEHVAEQEPWRERVQALRCFHGINTVTALALVAEIHDPRRFSHPRRLMSYLGLVPRESSSGMRERRGGITGAGNRHVRRLMVEASWHYRHRPSTLSLTKRRQGQPPRVVAIADKAMQRLHRRFTRMLERGKPRPKVVVAIARELTGFVWAAMRQQAA
jgi:transposase